MAARRSTSLDVASLAGVSAAAVSRAFTPGASIAPDTKKKVMAAAKQLGYQPNVLARSLNQRRSKLIGLIMSGWNNFGYVEILRLLTERLEAQGYEVILKSLLDGAEMGETVRQVLQYQVAAIAVVSEVVPAEITADCTRSGVPIVLVNRIGRGMGSSAVSLNGVQLGRRIGDFLIANRHLRVALLRGRDDIDFTTDTMAAITARIEASSDGKVIADESGVLGYQAGRQAINALFGQSEPPDAVFCSYDDTAVGVMDGARIDLGVRVPEELAVIGNGNRAVASWGSHDLTTVEYPRDEVIDKTLNILMSRLEDPELGPEAVLIEPELIIRGSTRAAAAD